MENSKKRAFFLGTTKSPSSEDRAYSNFVYALCLDALIHHLRSEIDISWFKRHDMIDDVSNIKDSVYDFINLSEILIFLVDQYDGSFNPNVWFELGVAAASTEKTFVVISQREQLPFYLNDVSPVVINETLMSWFKEHHQDFKANRSVMFVAHPYSFDQELDIIDDIKEFQRILITKIKSGKNPFLTQMENADIHSLGHGSLYDFVQMQISPSITEFIPGERDAFIKLKNEILNAKKSIRTTRLANQSIVTGVRENSDVHTDFMQALYSSSNKTGITFDRIISNNNPKKWHDIFSILLYCGGNTRVFVRKSKYYIGFELVVIDEKVSFIHFHNLSVAGDINSNNTRNLMSNQVVNSTLKINNADVGKKLSKVFDRMHHRDYDIDEPIDPSRTLIGIPTNICDGLGDKIAVKYQSCGILCVSKIKTELKHDDFATMQLRSREINDYLFSCFEKWYLGMDDFTDKSNMALGISMLDTQTAKRIIENFETFFPECNSENTDVKILAEKLKQQIESECLQLSI